MHIHRHIGAGLEHSVPDFGIDHEGILGIFLIHAPGAHLERMRCCRCSVIRIFGLHKRGSGLTELLDGHEVIFGDRADAPDSEYMGQSFGDFLEVIVGLRLYEDPSVGADHIKVPFTGAQGDPDLADQCFLKDMAVFSLDADLGIFDQKRIVFIHSTSQNG